MPKQDTILEDPNTLRYPSGNLPYNKNRVRNDFDLEDLSFEVSVPSVLLLNKNLEPSAIKLFCFVKSLTKAHGYCYASNKYLANCMGCDERTVSRLLNSLKNEGYLEIESVKNGLRWQRKIYMVLDLKKCLRNVKNVPSKGQKCPSTTTKMSQDIIDIVHIQSRTTTENDVADSDSSEKLKKSLRDPDFGKTDKKDAVVSIPSEDLNKKLIDEFKRTLKEPGQAERAVKYWIENEKELKAKARTNPKGLCITLIKANKDLEEGQRSLIINKRKQWAKENEWSGMGGDGRAYDDGFLVTKGSTEKFYKYNSNDSFWEERGLGFDSMS